MDRGTGVIAAVLLGAGAAVAFGARRATAEEIGELAPSLPSVDPWSPDLWISTPWWDGGGFGEMQLSERGLSFIKSWEGLRLTAYQDPGGVWTIGYGHTGPDVASGLTISLLQAQELLQADVQGAASAVNRFVDVPLTQEQFDALTSFVYNVGAGNFERSTLLNKLNSGDLAGAAAEFDKWVYAGELRIAGLISRRNAEQALFLTT